MGLRLNSLSGPFRRVRGGAYLGAMARVNNCSISLLVGEIATAGGQRGAIVCDQQDIALISFERQQAVYEARMASRGHRYASRGRVGYARCGLSVVLATSMIPSYDALNLRHRLHAFYRELSTGESRKLLVLKALAGRCPAAGL